MSVRIKRLEIHGFKSFMRSTVFEFDTGITAVIGPNGSGKSNIADAMRWVLGEQSYSNLRGRKAEDVIFSGSGARAAVGMAEVTLTLDNSSGDLPIDFQEVAITRRAYRSGENQYLVNGARVRLKDVQQITASLGQSHTVIGQGLVDAALSQRPDERRALFEHAAGITGLRLKYAATARHLAESNANSTRLDDLLTELEPRIKTLQRQAKQAREFAQVRDELNDTARRYYAALWREHTERLTVAQQQVDETESNLSEISQQLEGATAQVGRLANELRTLRHRSDALERSLADKTSALRDLQHRRELVAHRRETRSSTIVRLDTRTEELVSEAETIRTTIDEQRAERETINARLESIQERIAERDEARQELDQQIRALVGQRNTVQQQREALQQQIFQLQADQHYRTQQRDDAQERIQHAEERRTELERQHVDLLRHIDQQKFELDERQTKLEAREQQITETEAEHARQTTRSREVATEIETLERDRTRIAARLDALQRVQESGEGLYRGVQAVIKAAQGGSLSGVLGTLAGQITVPETYETAIEAGLGGHLQDIVVERWADAEKAIAHLKRSNSGRATFQPLDTVRAFSGQKRPQILSDDGVQGIAVDLIDFDSTLEPVLEGLLGRVVVTTDLQATRRILSKLRPGWTVVTLDGEVTRSGGSVTGGSRVRASGTLSRERELRELPEQLATFDKRWQVLQSDLNDSEQARNASEATLQQQRQERTQLRDAIEECQRAERELIERRERLNESIQTLEDEIASAVENVESSSDDLDRLAEQETDIRGKLSEIETQRSSIDQQIEDLQSTITDGEATRLESEQSQLTERLQGIDREIVRLETRLARIDEEHQQIATERAEAKTAIAASDAELHDADHSIAALETELTELRDQRSPFANERETIEATWREHQSTVDSLEKQQREHERRRDQQRFDVQRQESQAELLLERAADALELSDPIPVLKQQPDEPDLDFERLETSLHRLRQRARRIGAFGEDTIAQYEQEQERYTFLQQQLEDVQKGAEALQSMLDELDRAMTREFDQTFGQVAQAFSLTFKNLFGGGQARLIRTDNEDSIGIDIVAQPPGKKLQSLALLSGGERALTAVALLFAILRVNPSPFCLLDEVDAALDEANVVRFRDELRGLASKTQFVIVTHNRSTIEGADVLYGITMGDDAVSRVVSLKLPPEPART